jgi:hypothetical protein
MKFPDLPMASIGWRMGPGEDYRYAFQDWYRDLSNMAAATYRLRFPEPEQWNGFYARLREDEQDG